MARTLVGNYVTSLDMAGCSVTLCQVDEELLRLWDAPVQTAGARAGAADPRRPSPGSCLDVPERTKESSRVRSGARRRLLAPLDDGGGRGRRPRGGPADRAGLRRSATPTTAATCGAASRAVTRGAGAGAAATPGRRADRRRTAADLARWAGRPGRCTARCCGAPARRWATRPRCRPEELRDGAARAGSTAVAQLGGARAGRQDDARRAGARRVEALADARFDAAAALAAAGAAGGAGDRAAAGPQGPGELSGRAQHRASGSGRDLVGAAVRGARGGGEVSGGDGRYAGSDGAPVGIVLVSHSATGRRAPSPNWPSGSPAAAATAPVAAAGGTPDGGLGTSSELIAAAARAVDRGAGVAVLVDLGSAVLTVKALLAEGDELPDGARLVDAPVRGGRGRRGGHRVGRGRTWTRWRRRPRRRTTTARSERTRQSRAGASARPWPAPAAVPVAAGAGPGVAQAHPDVARLPSGGGAAAGHESAGLFRRLHHGAGSAQGSARGLMQEERRDEADDSGGHQVVRGNHVVARRLYEA